jgi:hypothetical protein
MKMLVGEVDDGCRVSVDVMERARCLSRFHERT